MKYCLFLISLCILLLGTGVFAQLPGNPDNWCREGFFTRETNEFGVGFVKGKTGSRAYFYKDDPEKCPDGAGCRTSSYLLPGDTVITNRERNGMVCAWFTSAKGAVRVGWLKASEIDFPNMLHDASERVWVGEWRYAQNSITINLDKAKGGLHVLGSAIWKGLGDNVHVGELDGNASPTDGILKYSDGDSEYDCKVTLDITIATYLIVADNGNCGGANVTFSGIYRKVASKRVSK